MTNEQRVALTAARAAVLGMQAEPQEIRNGSIRGIPGGLRCGYLPILESIWCAWQWMGPSRP